MRVKDSMTEIVVSVGPTHTLRKAARLMASHHVGAAVVMNVDGPGYSIITERDILISIGNNHNPDTEIVSQHMAEDVVFATPEWSLEEAAQTMIRGGFRHLIVLSDGVPAGIISVRDIVRAWTKDGAVCDAGPGQPFLPMSKTATSSPAQYRGTIEDGALADEAGGAED